MPHQCLKCGRTYEDGSKYVLEGCPYCGGRIFLYTKKPLPDKTRKKLLKKIENKEFFEFEGKKIEEIMEEIERRRQEAIIEAKKQKERVESIKVEEVGEYEINLERLVEGGIIVERGGIYFIYLPSLFSMRKK